MSPPPPLVSCLIATHNFAPYLARSIESVLSHDYPQDRIQVVVIDDGSEDDTEAIVSPYLDRVTYIHKPNGGLRSTINRGLQEARGELIAFHSGDDIWLPGRLRMQVELLRARPEVGLVYADMRVIDREDRTIHASFWDAAQVTPRRGRVLGALLARNFVSGGTLLVRASLRDRFWPLPEFAPWEDWWVALRVAEVAEIDYIDAPVSGYRRHGANMNLGADGERVKELLAAELPLRRWLLSELEAGAVKGGDWLRAHRRWISDVNTVAIARQCDAETLVEVVGGQSQAAIAAACQAGELLAAGAADAAARAAVRASALDPTATASRLALAAVGAVLEPGEAPAGNAPEQFVTLAFADELCARPQLLAAYGSAFAGDDDASLLVLVEQQGIAELSGAVSAAGLAGREAAKIVAQPYNGAGLGPAIAELALQVDAVLTGRDPLGPLQIRPHAAEQNIARLRELAERRWRAARPTQAPVRR